MDNTVKEAPRISFQSSHPQKDEIGLSDAVTKIQEVWEQSVKRRFTHARDGSVGLVVDVEFSINQGCPIKLRIRKNPTPENPFILGGDYPAVWPCRFGLAETTKEQQERVRRLCRQLNKLAMLVVSGIRVDFSSELQAKNLPISQMVFKTWVGFITPVHVQKVLESEKNPIMQHVFGEIDQAQFKEAIAQCNSRKLSIDSKEAVLNQDVVHIIIQFLSGRDLLAFSKTCKFFHNVVAPLLPILSAWEIWQTVPDVSEKLKTVITQHYSDRRQFIEKREPSFPGVSIQVSEKYLLGLPNQKPEIVPISLATGLPLNLSRISENSEINMDNNSSTIRTDHPVVKFEDKSPVISNKTMDSSNEIQRRTVIEVVRKGWEWIVSLLVAWYHLVRKIFFIE